MNLFLVALAAVLLHADDAVKKETAKSAADQAKQAEAQLDRAKQKIQRLEHDMVRLEQELNEAKAALEAAKGLKRRPVLYEGKPARFWLHKFTDRSPEYRAKALTALGHIGVVEKEVLPTIFEAMHDRDTKVWNAAIEAFATVGKDSVPYLIRALKDQRLMVRRNAVFALWRIGHEAKEAVPGLIEMLRKRDYQAFETITDFVPGSFPADKVLELAVERLYQIDPEIKTKLNTK